MLGWICSLKVGKNYKPELSDDLNGSQNGQFHFCANLGAERRGNMIVQTQHQRFIAGMATQLREGFNQANDGDILILTAARGLG